MPTSKNNSNQSVDKNSGSSHPSSIGERLYSVVQSVLAWEERNPLLSFVILMAGLLSLAFGLSGCATHTVPEPASTPTYADSNYHSVEMTACGATYFGVAGCSFASGESAQENLTIQGYNTGEISIFSDLCHVDWKTRYDINQAVQVSLVTLLGHNTLVRSDSCTMKIVVSPDPIKNSEDAVAPRVGEFVLEIRNPGIQDLGFPPGDQVRSSTQPDAVGLSMSMSEAGEYQLTKCSGEHIVAKFLPGLVVLPSFDRMSACKYQIAVKLTSGKKLSGTFLRNVYSAGTILLAQPVLQRDKEKLCVTADPVTTTFVSIDSNWANSNSICQTGPGPFTVRVWTVKRNLYEVVQ